MACPPASLLAHTPKTRFLELLIAPLQPAPLTSAFAANLLDGPSIYLDFQMSRSSPPSLTPTEAMARKSRVGAACGLVRRRGLAKNPALHRKLGEMAIQLSPLVQLTTGNVHPYFPRRILNFWLLTDAQLEELAHFYHQRTPCRYTTCYPCPVTWRSDMPLEEKRRKMGKFIGLRGCDSPVVLKTEGQIAAEARKASREREEEMWARKMGPWRS